MSAITTHVLDTSRGRPARGVPVHLERRDGDAFVTVSRARTNDDGRVPGLVPADVTIGAGVYRITFDTGAWFEAEGLTGFYPEVAVVFTIRDAAMHHHVPLLISPFGYSTYRGS